MAKSGLGDAAALRYDIVIIITLLLMMLIRYAIAADMLAS